MQYQETDGAVELAHRGPTASCHPEVLRVDYRALRIFRALDDRERFTALAQAFTCRAQYHCEIFIPVHREIIRVPDNFCEKVLHKLAAIAPYVTEVERTVSHKQKRGVGRSLVNQSRCFFFGPSARSLLVVQT